MIASPNYSQRSGRPVRLVILHTAEGARTVESLGNFFAAASVQASSHVGIDDRTIAQYVPYSMAAWTAGGANSISDQAELCGFAAWSRQTWLTQHMRMLELAAQWVRERCLARGIPIVKITPAQVAAGSAGVCGHVDWSVGMRDTDHTDPGVSFPWDVVINLANGGITTAPPVPVPSPIPRAPTTSEDDLMAPIPLNFDAAGRFHEAVGAEAGSTVASRGFVTFGSTYGGTTWTVAALGNDGAVLAYWPGVRINNNMQTARELPQGTRHVTVEGTRDNDGTRPWASTWGIR